MKRSDYMKIKTVVSIFVVCAIIFSITAYSAYVLVVEDNKSRLSTNLSEVKNSSLENNKINEEEIKKSEIVQLDKKEFKTTYNTGLIFKHKYIDEGYEVVEEKALGASMKGLTIEEVQKIYNEWIITSYDDKNIYLEKKIKIEDNSKYTVGIKDGYITVFENINGQLDLYMSTDKSIDNLYESDLRLLNRGIKVFNDGELLKILEDFES